MTRSLTALDHLEGMYSCWCSGMHPNDLFGLMYRMMELRGMLNNHYGVQEAAYYIDCFEYSQSPLPILHSAMSARKLLSGLL